MGKELELPVTAGRGIRFDKATINFCKHFEPDGRIVREKFNGLALDSRTREIIRQNEMYKSIFVGNEGRYACTSSMMAGFKDNPLGVDVFAVSELTKAFDRMSNSADRMLAGWHMYDAHGGYFVIQFRDWDEDGSVGYSNKLRYNPNTGKVVRNDVSLLPKYSGLVKSIEEHLPAVLMSLMGISLPVDLFEVCLASPSFSEEGYADNDGNVDCYLMTGELGYPENKTHTLTGVSLITESNGFSRHKALEGRYALLIVQ